MACCKEGRGLFSQRASCHRRNARDKKDSWPLSSSERQGHACIVGWDGGRDRGALQRLVDSMQLVRACRGWPAPPMGIHHRVCLMACSVEALIVADSPTSSVCRGAGADLGTRECNTEC